MKSKLRHVFDLDNTLVYTDTLNNNAYISALDQLGIETSRVRDCERITRDVVFSRYPELNVNQRDELIVMKQRFFSTNLKSTVPNILLLQLFESYDKEFCFLWTSAEKIRVIATLEHYKIQNAFQQILFSDKLDIAKDLREICQILKCDSSQLIFYEDNKRVIQPKLPVIITMKRHDYV